MIAFFRKLGWLVRRGSREDELFVELRFHLEEEAEERRTAASTCPATIFAGSGSFWRRAG